jgi:hypothetical protein
MNMTELGQGGNGKDLVTGRLLLEKAKKEKEAQLAT